MTGGISLEAMDIPDPKIGEVCRELMGLGEKITLRSVGMRVGVAHTTLSRDPARKMQVENARKLQQLGEVIRGTERGHIGQDESLPLAKARLRVEELESEIALLIASHRAMIMAVGEIGGMRAYRRFFEMHQGVLLRLEELKAIPEPVSQLMVVPPNTKSKGKR